MTLPEMPTKPRPGAFRGVAFRGETVAGHWRWTGSSAVFTSMVDAARRFGLSPEIVEEPHSYDARGRGSTTVPTRCIYVLARSEEDVALLRRLVEGEAA